MSVYNHPEKEEAHVGMLFLSADSPARKNNGIHLFELGRDNVLCVPRQILISCKSRMF